MYSFIIYLSSEIELKDLVCESRARIILHTVQLVPEKAFRENENIHDVTIEPDGMASMALQVIVSYTTVHTLLSCSYKNINSF